MTEAEKALDRVAANAIIYVAGLIEAGPATEAHERDVATIRAALREVDARTHEAYRLGREDTRRAVVEEAKWRLLEEQPDSVFFYLGTIVAILDSLLEEAPDEKGGKR